MPENLIESLRDTQKLLEGRLDEIDTLSSIVRILEPSIDRERFFLELAELLFSRNQVEHIRFYDLKEKPLPLWEIGCFDSEIRYGRFDVEKGAVEASVVREVVFETEKGVSKVFIPLVFGEECFGILSLSYGEGEEVSPFSRPFFYLLGSFNAASLRVVEEWKRISEKNERLSRENQLLKGIITGLGESENSFVFTSAAMNELISRIDRVKDLDVDILITGESGTGKDLLARYVHYTGSRKDKPLIAVNCAAIPESLVEGELFGIEEGVATGVKKRAGKFQMADGGTLFLDEVGELPLSIQAKLLRFLQDKRVTPVGSSVEREVDVRIVAATNRNLMTMVKDSLFREDLYYRLSNIPVEMPSLRHRREDIYPLFLYFFRYFSKKYSRQDVSLDENLQTSVESYNWPGNVRELKNRALQAVIMADDGSMIDAVSLGISSSDKVRSEVKGERSEEKIGNVKDWLENRKIEIEKRAIIEALRRTDGVKKQAAALLDISLRSFHYKFKTLGIVEEDYS